MPSILIDPSNAYDDILPVPRAADTINGLGGNDAIFGLDGNDSLIGGAGDNSLSGDNGAQEFFRRYFEPLCSARRQQKALGNFSSPSPIWVMRRLPDSP